MEEFMLVVVAVLSAAAGGALVWRWTSDDELEIPRVEASPASTNADALSHELERARRFERPFVLLHIPLGERSGDGDPEGECAAFQAVTDSLRSIDFAWPTDSGIDILLPEVGRADGEACLRRLGELVPGLVADARMAVFPEDGVTRGALLARLSGEAEALPDVRELPRPNRPVRVSGWAS